MRPTPPLRFPRLPDGFWQGAANAGAASAFLDAVEAWRAATLARLVDSSKPLTPAMIRLLRSALGAEADGAFPARVRRFPELGRLDSTALADAMAVVLWRAMLTDYLADVWDVVGTPDFDLSECTVAEDWLTPGALEGQADEELDICRICLAPLARRADGSGFVVHDNRCPALRALGGPSGNGGAFG
jgi:hypothetical protein